MAVVRSGHAIARRVPGIADSVATSQREAAVQSIGVTEKNIIAFVAQLDGVEVTVASDENGAPEVAWGDVFFSVPGRHNPSPLWSSAITRETKHRSFTGTASFA